MADKTMNLGNTTTSVDLNVHGDVHANNLIVTDLLGPTENIDTIMTDGFYTLECAQGTFPCLKEGFTYEYCQLIVLHGGTKPQSAGLNNRVVQIISGPSDDYPAWIRYGLIPAESTSGVPSWTNWRLIATSKTLQNFPSNIWVSRSDYPQVGVYNPDNEYGVCFRMGGSLGMNRGVFDYSKGQFMIYRGVGDETLIPGTTVIDSLYAQGIKAFKGTASEQTLLWHNGVNLWIGSTGGATTHHYGATYISSGYDESSQKGNYSIYVAVPNTTNTGCTSYKVLHEGNFMKKIGDHWGMTEPTNKGDTVWIRTTTSGILPYEAGGKTSGHSALGTANWYFSKSYIQDMYANVTYSSQGIVGGYNDKYKVLFAGDSASSTEHKLTLQSDHNLVYYVNNKAVWSTNTSSKRFKHNIKDMTEERALKVLDMRPITFDYNEGVPCATRGINKAGFIAEELEKVVDDLVIYERKENDEEIPLSVQYEGLTPYLVKLCQMQQKQIDELTARIEKLEEGGNQ